MYFEPHQFAFVEPLQSHWREIRREFEGIRDGLMDWFETELYGEGWQVFGLFDFPHGRPLVESVRKCPVTSSLIETNIPAHGAAGFSVLKPQTRIQPHVGYAGRFLRLHLGLIVPTGDCVLRVNGEQCHWREGEALVFDDRKMHDAWNLTDEERVVLLVDFVPET